MSAALRKVSERLTGFENLSGLSSGQRRCITLRLVTNRIARAVKGMVAFLGITRASAPNN